MLETTQPLTTTNLPDPTNGECRFVIVGRKRTLELQAKDTQIRDRWIEAVTFWTRYMIE